MASNFPLEEEEQIEETVYIVADNYVEITESIRVRRDPLLIIADHSVVERLSCPYMRYDSVATITHVHETRKTYQYNGLDGEFAFLITFITTMTTTVLVLCDGSRSMSETRYWRIVSKDTKKEEDFEIRLPEEL